MRDELSVKLRRALKRAVSVSCVLELLARADALKRISGWAVDLEEEKLRDFERVVGVLTTSRRRIKVVLTYYYSPQSRLVVVLRERSWKKTFTVRGRERALWPSTYAFFDRIHAAAVQSDLDILSELAEEKAECQALSP